jgi:hypothetical protein
MAKHAGAATTPPAFLSRLCDLPAEQVRRVRVFRLAVLVAVEERGVAVFGPRLPSLYVVYPCVKVRRAGRLVAPDLSVARSVSVYWPGPRKRAAGSQWRVYTPHGCGGTSVAKRRV